MTQQGERPDLDDIARGSGDPVARVELYHYAAPLPATFHPAWIPGFPQTENRATLVRVITRDGVEGWSAGPALSRERRGLGDLLGPYLVGEDATDIHLVQQRLREMGYLGWRNWWLEPAFWDIKAKKAGVPLWRLLGGSPQRVGLYASSGEVRTAEERAEEAATRFAEGFRILKIRVHEDEEADIRQVEGTAARLPDGMRIAVDANQAWRVTAIGDAPLWDLPRARRFADRCAAAGVVWLEEPLPMDAYDDLAALTEYSKIPMAGGELHTSALAELSMMLDRRCYDILQPDAMFTGGVLQTLRLARLCRERGRAYTPHTWTNGIGFAVNLHVFLASGFAAERALEYPLDPPGWVPEARDAMLTVPFLHDHGELDPPERPGLGIEIDRRALRRHGKRFFAMDRKRLVWFALRDRGVKASREIDRVKRERSSEQK
ncbi:MAG TPA: mandelate racemase/muconate lactonizing enzyme family protein [Actinomycetota bacterium]|nr:mandelate racemase/muconate lactonizing enzyme family protein [Actinomycetota bacterium]